MRQRGILKKLIRPIQNEHGSLLLITYFSLIVILGIGAAFMQLAVHEARIAERQKFITLAFHTAEAGIERGLYDLRQDFVLAVGPPSWNDNDINGYTIGPDTVNYYAIPYSSTSINGGTYTVQLKNVAGANDDIWVKSTGSLNGVDHVIETYVKMVNLSPWDYAIFAGSGASGTMINGNVDIRGSVLILGNGLAAGDYAIDLGGTAEIVGNNYSGLDAALKALVPALSTTTFNGEVVETLNSVLRVKKGLVGVSGSSEVGQADVSGNTVKETVDAVYVTDGWGGNQGTNNVHSDNGTSNAYDLGDSVQFPSLSDPYPGYATYQAYLKDNAYVLTATEEASLASMNPTSSFSYGDANGSISMDGSGNLTINGIVYVDNGSNVAMSKQGSNKTITYSGKGTLLVTGNVQIDVNLVTSGANSFPTNIMGIMTPNSMDFNEAGIDVMGVFYAENTIRVQKQTDLVGTIVSNYFDMGTNVPSVYQVPDTVNNLPPGMIGTNSMWYMIVAWLKP